MKAINFARIGPRTIFIGLLFFLNPNFIFSQGKDKNVTVSDSVSDENCLKFTCKVITAEEPINPVEITLFLNNNVIDHRVLDKNKTVKFFLKRDAYYFIQISAPFYITRYAIVNTNLPQKLKVKGALYKFLMEIELFKEPKMYYTADVNSEVLDKPVTVIRYKEDDDSFEIDAKYTNNIKRELRKFQKSISKLGPNEIKIPDSDE